MKHSINSPAIYKLRLQTLFGIFKIDFAYFLLKHRAECGGQPVTPALIRAEHRGTLR